MKDDRRRQRISLSLTPIRSNIRIGRFLADNSRGIYSMRWHRFFVEQRLSVGVVGNVTMVFRKLIRDLEADYNDGTFLTGLYRIEEY